MPRAAAGLKLTLKGRRPSNDGAPPGVTARCRTSLQDVARNREAELLRRTRELELQLEVHRLAACDRELELQMMVHKMTQTTLRFTEAEGARWCAPSVWFAPAVKRRAGECQSLCQACACTHMPIRPPNGMRNQVLV